MPGKGHEDQFPPQLNARYRLSKWPSPGRTLTGETRRKRP